MKRTVGDRRPHLKPVERIELEEKHFTLRVVLFVLFLVIGAVALIYGLSGLFANNGGWQLVEADTSEENCSDEFLLRYELGRSDLSARAEYKQVAEIYGNASVKAYRLFHGTKIFDGVVNVAYLNEHPNESVAIDKGLYNAFSLMLQNDNRQLFLAPIYEYYSILFICTEDHEIVSYDPTQNNELAGLFEQICGFANDPDAISLELKDNNQVCLRVSESYLDFARENDIYSFIDFQWMKNAFIIDYIADALVKNSFTNGAISSFDGYCRNLDRRGTSYSLNLFDRDADTVLCAGSMSYTQPLAIVSLRTFPINSSDNTRYYVRQSGETIFPYLDPISGRCTASLSNLTCYSSELGCAEVLMKMLPVYIADSFDVTPLYDDAKLDTVFCEDGAIKHTAENVSITVVTDGFVVKPAGKN